MERLLRPIPATVLAIFLPGIVSVFGWFSQFGLFCSGRQKGANVEHALVVAQLGSVFVGFEVLLLLFLARDAWRWRRLLVAACVAEAALVSAACAFLAADSATVAWADCSFMGPATNETDHLTWLYVVWGISIALLLYQAIRVARYSPQPETMSEPDVSGPPLD